MMNADEFKLWRKRLDITQVDAASLLKLTPRAVQHYEGGTRGISDQIAMLTFAVEKRFWRGKHKSKGTHDFYDPRDIVATPQPFFDRLDAEFHFTLDVCAVPENAKCAKFFAPETNGLAQRWVGACFCNPPFFQGRVGVWVAKAFEEAQRGAVVVAILPVVADSQWWHDYVLRAHEIRFIRGRLAGFGRNAVVVFRRGKRVPKTSTISANG
jgi:phage N-6-adenine-methyltransferase